MELGWIDFSKTERNKILSVLELIGEKGVLDELGIGPIRDGFSNLFFPGTSTLQTRAKYFLLTAYILKDLELSDETDFNKLRLKLDKVEKKCGELFLENGIEDGVIGIRSLNNGGWVKRAPSSLYWAGIRKFGIFKSNKTLNDYLKLIAFQNLRKTTIKNQAINEDEDNDAGDIQNTHLLNIPTYKKEWVDKKEKQGKRECFNNLELELSREEGKFLRKQIIENCPDSLFAFILKENLTDILELDNFNDLESILFKFPDELKENFYLAKDFSEFNYFLNTIYNIIVSDEKNKEAISKLEEFDTTKLAKIDLERIYAKLKIRDPRLKRFLKSARTLTENNDIEGLKELIIKREIILKGENRAKTSHPGEYELKWYAAKELNYRFSHTQRIIQDIFLSQGLIDYKILNYTNEDDEELNFVEEEY